MHRAFGRVFGVLLVAIFAIGPAAGITRAGSGSAGLDLVPLRPAEALGPSGTLGPMAALQCGPMPEGLVSWWPGDDDAADIRDGNDGALQGAAFTTGKVGQAFSLNGVSDFVAVPDSSSLDLSSSLTIDAWISLQALPPEFAPIASKWNDIGVVNRGYFLAVLPDGRVRFDVSANGGFGSPNSEQVVSSARVPLNVFTHVAGVFDADSGMLRVYVDGDESASVRAVFNRVFLHKEPLLIGAGDLGGNARDFFRGVLDEVGIYARALSGAEIAAIFSAGSAGRCKPEDGEPSPATGPEDTQSLQSAPLGRVSVSLGLEAVSAGR